MHRPEAVWYFVKQKDGAVSHPCQETKETKKKIKRSIVKESFKETIFATLSSQTKAHRHRRVNNPTSWLREHINRGCAYDEAAYIESALRAHI